jgi:APA family basic amino acid/polyamine antiporter
MANGDQELARDLGFLEAYTLGLGTMIGAGIFVLPGIVAESAGPASAISFAIGGVVALLAALSLSELATGMPKAGGSYYYVNHALGSFFGTIVGWGMWAGLMFATAFYMLGFGQYLFNQPSGALLVNIAALVMASLLVAINYRGVKETGSLQNVIVIALIGLIFAFLAVGLTRINTDLLTPFAPAGWSAVGATAGTVFVTFIGFEVIATSAEEIKDPGRTLPLSMIAAVVTPTILYVLVMLVSTGILPVPELATSEVPVADVAATATGVLGSISVAGVNVEFATVGSVIMIAGAILATVSSANASILSAARVNFAMGRDRILTNWLNRIHGQYRTPYRAIVATGAVILLLIASPLPIATLADVASFMFLITYALVHVAVIVLRRAQPEEYEPDFRIPSLLYPTVPVLGVLTCLAVMVGMEPVVQAIGIGIVLVGVGWYQFYAKEKAIATSLVGEAIAETPERVTDETVYRVVVPVANPDTQRHLLRLAAASARASADMERIDRAEIVAVNITEVPPQTSLAQIEFEEERVERQRELLSNARASAEEFDVGIRTRAIAGRNIGNTILTVINEEEADEVLLGWDANRSRREHVFGSNLDPIMARAPCEVTFVQYGRDRIGDVVVLVSGGPHTPAAIRRGAEFAASEPDATLTLLNVQRPAESNEAADDDSDGFDPEAEGRAFIAEIAEDVGLSPEEYETRIKVSSEIETAIFDAIERYETICLGTTREGVISQALSGALPERIGQQVSGTVVMVRDEETAPRSIREALVERLS